MVTRHAEERLAAPVAYEFGISVCKVYTQLRQVREGGQAALWSRPSASLTLSALFRPMSARSPRICVESIV